MAALASFMEMGVPCWEGGCHTDPRMVPLPTHQCTLCTSRPPTPIILALRSKAFVILFERGVRVVVHTANLIYPDCNNKTQALYTQDFPPAPDATVRGFHFFVIHSSRGVSGP